MSGTSNTIKYISENTFKDMLKEIAEQFKKDRILINKLKIENDELKKRIELIENK